MAALSHGQLRLLAIVGCIVPQCIFGGYAVMLQVYVVRSMDPLVFTLFRDLLACPILFAVAAITEGVRWATVADIRLFLVLGMSMAGNHSFNIVGNALAGSAVAAILQPSIPVMTAALAIPVAGESPPALARLSGWLKLMGMLSAVAGVVSMALPGLLDRSRPVTETWPATVGKGLWAMQKRWIFLPRGRFSEWKEGGASVTAWTYVSSTAVVLVAVLAKATVAGTSILYVDRQALIPMCYAAVLNSALAYCVLTFSNKVLCPSVVTAFWPLQVPICLLLTHIFLPSAAALTTVRVSFFPVQLFHRTGPGSDFPFSPFFVRLSLHPLHRLLDAFDSCMVIHPHASVPFGGLCLHASRPDQSSSLPAYCPSSTPSTPNPSTSHLLRISMLSHMNASDKDAATTRCSSMSMPVVFCLLSSDPMSSILFDKPVSTGLPRQP
eukprot:GGOE01006803.1.p1 GENE.GGOE01006803.1~~GGOE01006803.1.p1  ORF type:complete len:446 (-),score=63.99 GGOE01006803.1:151-1464(-)